ncbi:hypothetical protein [Chondrinema litorale]|uniref:hypothetical protein n=1 Tax=Chondrinema litorale TaxID=2994555 RepID=UPI002543D7EC|nr:hypothetical protein [Chondrinema litorale]UZR92687.1 hypothetical protein OQ292_12550 [Chondrinema litorale]
MKVFDNIGIILLLCITLGLAPFTPEPHVLGKIKWVMGGGVGMKLIDYFDLIFHGLPWLLLVRVIFLKIVKFIKISSKRISE